MTAMTGQPRVAINLEYKGAIVGQPRIDLLVSDRLIVELNAVECLAPVHLAHVPGHDG